MFVHLLYSNMSWMVFFSIFVNNKKMKERTNICGYATCWIIRDQRKTKGRVDKGCRYKHTVTLAPCESYTFVNWSDHRHPFCVCVFHLVRRLCRIAGDNIVNLVDCTKKNAVHFTMYAFCSHSAHVSQLFYPFGKLYGFTEEQRFCIVSNTCSIWISSGVTWVAEVMSFSFIFFSFSFSFSRSMCGFFSTSVGCHFISHNSLSKLSSDQLVISFISD